MDDATRYQREFDVIIQETNFEAHRKENLDRDARWHEMEKAFNEFFDKHHFRPEDKEEVKRTILDRAMQERKTLP